MHTGLISLQTVARMSQVDIDLRAVVREFAVGQNEVTPQELLRIAKHLGFKARLKALKLASSFCKYPLPAIFLRQDGTYGVLLEVKPGESKALVFVPPDKAAQELTFDELRQIASGQFLILAHKQSWSQVAFGFRWFYEEILRYKQVIAEVMTGSFVVQLFGLITPLFTQVIIDKVVVHRSMSTLDVLGVAFLFVIAVEFLLNLTRNYIFIHTANKIDAKLGAKLFRHLFSLPFVYFESRKVGNIAARVRELDNIREFITSKSVSVIIDLIFSLVFVVMMLLYSVTLTLIVLAFVAVVAVIYVTVTPELRQRLENKFQMAAESNSYLVESVTGVQTVKSLAIEGSMQRKWEDRLAEYLQASFKLSSMGTVAGAISGALQRLMTVSVLYLGVRLVIDHQLTIGQLIAFQMFANQFTGPVLRLVNLWNEFQQTLLAVDRIGDILNHPVEVQSSKAITLPSVQGSIRFDNVSFQYVPGGPPVLDRVSFEVKPGTTVGLVGRSGSGKSTIAKLIQRLYLPTEGAIYLDGLDIREVRPSWLRHNIGIVLQENYLFSGTIRENICLPRPDAPIELILEAARIAGAHDFISQLPQGYDTVVGERGSTLSGGQKQRIAIARALITNPKILIFDEATSALDYESEEIIQRNLARIKAGRTMLIIAHRLTALKNCDVIITLDKGRVVEQGPHQQLVAKSGYYANLYNQQARLSYVPIPTA